ncbi:hypothetical protein [Agrococcus sp. SGAir0287]|uniref:hypothetical protein n=1 Tax=Agrococcus sp. SGAir0287 TaxID=2070347 RepID=UPI0010CD1220|nr:hypothetical protein [Agrococcus sp. SGAir0287]QCR19641.1 hypothetical protein C1N71_09600 [Agrococcus sp. SGAir0287]
MIDWLMIVQAAVIAVLGAAVAVAGIVRVRMNDLVLAAAALTMLSLVVQVVASIVAPIVGAGPTGDLLEYWVYLVSALLIPPAATLWAFAEKGRWGVLVVGVGLLAVAVMVYRMHQIWFVQVV